MTREEELDWLCRLRSEIYVYMPKEWLIPMNNALDMAISALSAEGDLISRQTAIDAFERFIHELGIKDEPYNYGEMALSAQNVPSVENKGEWLDDGFCGDCKCSVCKHEFDYDIANMRGFDFALPKFCPNCGADMRGE